jgi:hypothetical protein
VLLDICALDKRRDCVSEMNHDNIVLDSEVTRCLIRGVRTASELALICA